MFLFFIFTLPECTCSGSDQVWVGGRELESELTARLSLRLPGVTDSFAVLIVFRFLAGCSCAGTMCNAAGSIGDLWAVNERGNKMFAFSGILLCVSPFFLDTRSFYARVLLWSS